MCSDQPGAGPTDAGVPLTLAHGPGRPAAAELVIVLPGTGFHAPLGPEVLAALAAAHERGSLIAAPCVGTFTLAATGLLDGRRATTHWRSAGLLARSRPDVTVEPDAPYVDEGRIATGAGAAGAGLCLHLIRREHGAAVVNHIARDVVLPSHRDGEQVQYLAVPVPEEGRDERPADVLARAREHLHEPLPVAEPARRAVMSKRSFAARSATPPAPPRTPGCGSCG
ncbi:GlxA family transcriptional regulator [Streptomyces sp. NPDC059851]|uniref:GlxA family transcriptional regulator n=1 Tax=Streptomyces sp. NPDC059851 TaxID=3346971 RepID=UPI00365A0069